MVIMSLYYLSMNLGVFCCLCGILRHTDKACPKLFDMESDDGSLYIWGGNLHHFVRRMGAVASNKWMQDPIICDP
jgi:hypothetical protein